MRVCTPCSTVAQCGGACEPRGGSMFRRFRFCCRGSDPDRRRRVAVQRAGCCRRRGLAAGGQRCRHRARVRARARRKQAGLVVLGCEVVPAVQPVEGHAVQPARLHRTQQVAGAGGDRWRPARRAEARQPLQGERLPDDGAGAPGRRRDHPLAGRSRCAAGVAAAATRPGGRPADQGGARRRTRRQDDQRRRVAHAGVLFVDHRRVAARATRPSAPACWLAWRRPARPARPTARRG